MPPDSQSPAALLDDNTTSTLHPDWLTDVDQNNSFALDKMFFVEKP